MVANDKKLESHVRWNVHISSNVFPAWNRTLVMSMTIATFHVHHTPGSELSVDHALVLGRWPTTLVLQKRWLFCSGSLRWTVDCCSSFFLSPPSNRAGGHWETSFPLCFSARVCPRFVWTSMWYVSIRLLPSGPQNPSLCSVFDTYSHLLHTNSQGSLTFKTTSALSKSWVCLLLSLPLMSTVMSISDVCLLHLACLNPQLWKFTIYEIDTGLLLIQDISIQTAALG